MGDALFFVGGELGHGAGKPGGHKNGVVAKPAIPGRRSGDGTRDSPLEEDRLFSGARQGHRASKPGPALRCRHVAHFVEQVLVAPFVIQLGGTVARREHTGALVEGIHFEP